MPGSDVVDQFQSSEKGLSRNQVNERLVRYGANEVAKRKVRTSLFVFVSQFRNPLVILLMIASVVAAFLGELADATIIIIIVVINGLLGFFQEYRSEKALERLRKYVTFTAKVVRDGAKRGVDARELVPGDIVLVGTGDVVPADMRLLRVDELSVDESSLSEVVRFVSQETRSTADVSPRSLTKVSPGIDRKAHFVRQNRRH